MPLQPAGFDYVIVGAGSAGCVLANRLTASGDARVLLLEAGGEDSNFWLKLPVGYFRTIYDPRFSRVFDAEGGPQLQGRKVAWPRGRILGGSSSINGLIYIRGQKQDYQDWVDTGAQGWSYEDVLPYFRKSERFTGPESRYHGTQGELGVSELRNDHPYCKLWVEAAQQAGLPANSDFNGDSDFGVGNYQLTLQGGWRSSASAAFLRPARSRKNLTVVTGAHVTRVLFENKRACGIEWLKDGQLHSCRADAEVLLSAGAIQSPQLLQHSGIGDARHLAALGIGPIVDAPEVGRNLQDHYQVRTIVKLKKSVSLNNQVRNPLALANMGLQWLLFNRGPLTVGAGQVGGFACTPHSRAGRPDMQFSVMPLSVDKPGQPLHAFSGFTATASQCRPLSRGSLAIVSADPLEAPRIQANYLSEDIDRKTVVAGIRMLREIYDQPAFRGLIDSEVLPNASQRTDEEILDFAQAQGSTVFHPCGTCRMGEDGNAVVDSQLRVHGVSGLRVVDASVMPTMVSANINAATIMIGEKGAAMIMEAAHV